MGHLGGKLYIASYPAARISIYDPSKPYRFGEDTDANPRDIGRLDDVGYRPRAMLCGPAGRIWVGSIPDYGMWGGTLASLDPATLAIKSHRHLVQDCSPVALEWLPEPKQIAVGMSIHGGSGTTPRATRAPIVFWDPAKDAAVGEAWNCGVDEPIDGFLDLRLSPDGLLYAIVGIPDEGRPRKVRAELLVLDPAKRRLLERDVFAEDEGWPRELSLQVGPGGALYGCTHLRIYRIHPGSARREPLHAADPANDTEHIDCPGPVIGSRLYFGWRYMLRAIDL
jgi:hypothetical protein